MNRFVFLLIIFFVVIACEKQEVADRFYAHVETLEPADYDSTGITLRGMLIPGHEKIEEFGFLITRGNGEALIVPVEAEKDGYFEFRDTLSVYPSYSFVRAYVVSNSFISLGRTKNYTTSAFADPSVYELSVDHITISNATIFTRFYEIDYHSNTTHYIKDMGVVLHKLTNPTLEANSRIFPVTESDPSSANDYYHPLREYYCRLKGLSPSTSYYARIYYRRDNGTVFYSDQINFTTKESYYNPGGGLVDVDGNHYQTVFINEQEWMAENLRTITFSNGGTIGQGHAQGIWSQDTRPLYSWYPHSMLDGLHSDEDVKNAFGILYNGYAAGDERGICPEGWRVPSVDDWKGLFTYIEDETGYDFRTSDYNGFGFGKEMFVLYQCQSQTHPNADCQTSDHPRWSEPIDTVDVHNVFGLSFAPTGFRNSKGQFYSYSSQKIDEARYWTSDNASFFTNYYVYFWRENGMISESRYQTGYSVRCVR
jgi:uncharacterized protein (TIGR02145 family)